MDMMEDESNMNDVILGPSVARQVTIGICTSALRPNIEALITKVSNLTNVTVRFVELPYNDLDRFRLKSEGLDGVIICHSINNRRFAVTDVMDALYDKFLPHVKQIFGENNVCVIAHDFPWPMGPARSSHDDHIRIKDTYMNSFRIKQPTTFKCSKLAMICGRLNKQVDMDEEDWKRLVVFIPQCRAQPESYKSAPDPSKYVPFVAKAGMFTYLTLRYCRPVQCIHFPLGEDSAPLPSVPTSQSSQGIVGFVIWPVWFPFKVVMKTVDFIFSCTVPNSASHTVWTSFQEDVINKTLERSKSHTGLFGIFCWMCSFPSRLFFNSCMFAVTLVWRCSWNVCKYLGVAIGAYIVIPFIGKVYCCLRSDGQIEGNEMASDGEILHWSKAPWWKIPSRFWHHFYHMGVTHVSNLLNYGQE